MQQLSLLTQEQDIEAMPLFSGVAQRVKAEPFVARPQVRQAGLFGQMTLEQMAEVAHARRKA